MTRFSRRQFLQLAGISLAGLHLDPGQFFAQPINLSPAYGRALTATTAHIRPDTDSPAARHIWPDSIVIIHDHDGRWYRTDGGYIDHHHIQPVRPEWSVSPLDRAMLPVYAEVVGPVAVVRAWCAADAPLVTRIGHGGIIRVIDVLSIGNHTWYRIEDTQGGLSGWSQVTPWKPLSEPASTGQVTQLVIDRQSLTLTAYHDRLPLVTVPVALGRPLAAGAYPLRQRTLTRQTEQYAGVPWSLDFENDLTLSGVYWHNHFQSQQPGPDMQVNVLAARWLYQALSDHALLSIR